MIPIALGITFTAAAIEQITFSSRAAILAHENRSGTCPAGFVEESWMIQHLIFVIFRET
jgi:hypothetical protein